MLPLGNRIRGHRVVADSGAAQAQAAGGEPRAEPALCNKLQGTVPPCVRIDGPLMSSSNNYAESDWQEKWQCPQHEYPPSF